MAYVSAKDAAGATVKFKVDAFNDGSDDVNLQKLGVAITYTDRSGTITTGGTAQQMIAASSLRRKLVIENPDTATEDLWIRFTGTAVVGGSTSWKLGPGDSWAEDAATGCTTQAVSVIAATTGHAWRAIDGA